MNARVSILFAAIVFLLLALPNIGAMGVVSEEALPYLTRPAIVLAFHDGAVERLAPYEPNAPSRPRAYASRAWPVVGYDGASRSWPLFIRGHQTALATYFGIALSPLLGGGIEGVRRSSALLGAIVIALVGFTASRLAPSRRSHHASLFAALSFGMLVIARTGYGFELGSRVMMMGAVALAAFDKPPDARRSIAIGAFVGASLLCRATIATALFPALLVLLVRRDARPTKRSLALGLAVAVALPVLVVGALRWLAPFPNEESPLATLPKLDGLAMLASLPRQVLLSLAWLGDATSIWGPLARGETSLGLSALLVGAAISGVSVLAASVRWALGEARVGERMFVAASAGVVIGGALLYRDPNQFQLALALEPLAALALADQVDALVSKRAAFAFALVIATRGLATYKGLSLGAHVANPMLSGRAQRVALAKLEALGAQGSDVLTTVYNQAGVLETLSRGTFSPVNAWPLFVGADDCRGRAAFDAIFRSERPSYVLFTVGANLYESGGIDPVAIRASFDRAASLVGIEAASEGVFATESGAPGWELVRLSYPATLAPVHDVDCASTDPRVSSYRGLHTGQALGAVTITAIEALDKSAVIRARIGDREAVFDLSPERADGPTPPAASHGLGVFYRSESARMIPRDELVAAAKAIADAIDPAQPATGSSPSHP